jgi:hypothetical protein
MKSFTYFDGKEYIWVANSDNLYLDILDSARRIFSIDKYQNHGLTDQEVVSLLQHFLTTFKFK